MCVSASLASDSSETVEVMIIKLGMLIASDMRMHHVLIILTLIFIQGHTDLNHENNKCSIISETFQAMPIKFAVQIFQLKVYIMFSQSNDLVLHSRSQLRLKTWQMFNLYYNSNISQYLSCGIQTWYDSRHMHGIYAHAHFDNLGLDARSHWVIRGKIVSIELSPQLSKQ